MLALDDLDTDVTQSVGPAMPPVVPITPEIR
jgi:hypothetical protein